MGWKVRKLDALHTQTFDIAERTVTVDGKTDTRPASQITLAFDKADFESGKDCDAVPIVAVSTDGTASLRWEPEKKRKR